MKLTRIFYGLCCFVLVAFILGDSTAVAQGDIENQSVAGETPSRDKYISGEVLVKFKEPINTFSVAEKSSLNKTQHKLGVSETRPIIKGKLALKGLKNTYLMKFDTRYSVETAMDQFQSLSNVSLVQPNYLYHTTAASNDTYFDNQWGLDQSNNVDIDAPEAWGYNVGDSSYQIAIIDTGVDYVHPDLNLNIWTNSGEIPDNGIDDDGNLLIDDYYGYDWVNNDKTPLDDEGHGTHCAGIVAAETNNAYGVAGIAGGWNSGGCQIMALKAFDSGGSGGSADIAAALNYAADKGAEVVSMSFVSKYPDSTIETAIINAYDDGCLLVAAAGNDNTAPLPYNGYPAKYSDVIAVTALEDDGTRASYANYGSWVDISAPGSRILSTIWESPNTHTWDYMSGTSMATPCVAGVAAMVKSVYTAFSNDDIKDRLLATTNNVDNLNASYQGNIGSGMVNAFSNILSPFWYDWTSSSTPTTAGNISLVSFGGIYYQAMRGSDNVVYTRASIDGVTWGPWNGNGSTSSDVTMAEFNGKLYQAVRGLSTNKVYTRSTANGVDWSTWVGDGATSSNIAMAAFGAGRIYQSVKALNSDNIYTRYSVDGTTWSGWNANGKTASDVSLCVLGGANLFQAVRGASTDAVYTRFTADGDTWSAWTSNGTTSSKVTMFEFSGKIYEAVRGLSSKRVYTRSTANGVAWSAWSDGNRNHQTAGNISMASFGSTLLQGFRGLSDSGVYTRVSADGTTWSAWMKDGTTTSDVNLYNSGSLLFTSVRGYSTSKVCTRRASIE